jgi:hypothetical protein
MNEIELILELPAEDASEADFPEPEALPRRGEIGRALGLDGDQVLQLAVVVSAGTVRVLRTWLLARAEQRKSQRVVRGGDVFEGYTPEEIELLVKTLDRDLD